MAVAYPYDFAVGIFTSANLIDWTPTSNFTHHGLLGLQWECPNLVSMPFVDEHGDKQENMWTMIISINPGAPLGGSVSQFYPGGFNGTHFTAVDSAARIADFGKDNYAAQFFYGVPEEEDAISVAWASNWQYTQVVPTAETENWRSAMSLPRRNHLTMSKRVGWKLVSTPYDMEPIMGDVLASNTSLTNGTVTVDFSEVESNALYWEANVTGIPDTGIPSMATMNFTFASPQTGEYIRGGFYFGGDTPFYLDRGGARAFDNVFFTDKISTNSLVSEGMWSMSGVLDRSIIEVFLNNGTESATTTFFATQPLTLMVFATSGLTETMRVSVRINALESGWARMASPDDGLVYGNQSGKLPGSEDIRHLLVV